MSRKEVRVPRKVEVPEVRAAVKALGPGVKELSVRGGRVRLEREGRVDVHVKRWQSMIIGQKDKGTLFVVRAAYPPAIWLWLIPGLLPVFIAQAIYDRKVRRMTGDVANLLQTNFGGAA